MKRVDEITTQGAQLWPDKVAISDIYGVLSYSDLEAAVTDRAEELHSAGLRPGNGLGLVFPNGRDFIVNLFAGLRCGATVVPIHPSSDQDAIDALLAEASLRYLWSPEDGITSLHSGKEDLFERYSDVAFVRFTSGTTGPSKGVVLSHDTVLERIETFQKTLKLTTADTIVWTQPMAYHFAISIVMYLRYGACIAICKDNEPETIVDTANNNKATILYGAPSDYESLILVGTHQKLSTVKLALSTATAMSGATAESFRYRFDLPVTQAYGIIEVGIPILNTECAETDPGAVGKAVEGYEVAILDDDGNQLPAGSTGELVVRGPGMFDGYLSPPRDRKELLKDGWFCTGDVASIDSEGLVHVKGRKSAVVIVDEQPVYPEEVEEVLNSHPAIKFARVYPGSDKKLAADLVIFQEHKLDISSVVAYCNEKLKPHQIPQRISLVESIPFTKSGKVLRSTLQKVQAIS